MRENSNKKCSVVGCGRGVAAKGLCGKHWQRMAKHGHLDIVKPAFRDRSGSKNSNWRGGIQMDRSRVKIHSPQHPRADAQGYVYRYRLVAEARLGRYLDPTEVIHHINGIDSDDRPENLQVMTQSEHIRLEHPKLHAANQNQIRNKDPRTGRFLPKSLLC